jgi:hypothetical protein
MSGMRKRRGRGCCAETQPPAAVQCCGLDLPPQLAVGWEPHLRRSPSRTSAPFAVARASGLGSVASSASDTAWKACGERSRSRALVHTMSSGRLPQPGDAHPLQPIRAWRSPHPLTGSLRRISLAGTGDAAPAPTFALREMLSVPRRRALAAARARLVVALACLAASAAAAKNDDQARDELPRQDRRLPGLRDMH